MATTPVRASNRLAFFLPLLGVLVAIAAVMMACGGSSTGNTGSLTTGGSTPGASAKHYKVSDQVSVGGIYTVTVNSAQTHGATDVDTPKANDTYLVINVTLKNTSSSEQDLSSLLQFTLKDSTGQTYDETITSFQQQSPDGKVEAGSLVSGDLVYEVPTAQTKFTLSFQADITSNGETIWDITD